MFSFTNMLSSFKKINTWIGFEDVKVAIQPHNNKKYMLINTLPETEQTCLIQYTVNANNEEMVMNEWMLKDDAITIIVYGRNAVDKSAEKKCEQLKKLGFDDVYVYTGGLFEWLLLQNVYGEQEFPTTKPCSDLLHFRALPIL